MKYEVLLFYKYVKIEKPEEISAYFRTLCEKNKLLGRAIIADEGINATLEGEVENAERFVKEFLKHELFKDTHIKRSEGDGKSFRKLSIKIRNEIVGTRFDKNVIDPTKQTGKYITATDLREMYEKGEDFVIVDMRNDYEFAVGHFRNSINPKLDNSRDLPEAVKTLEPFKNKKMVTVCTGGVRCEKMSAYMMHEGFEDVSQLHGGMHTYMEKYPGKDFLGALYTFDGRVVMHFGGDREIVGRCRFCDAKTERYVNCQNLMCHLHYLICEDCEKEKSLFCSEECKDKVAIKK